MPEHTAPPAPATPAARPAMGGDLAVRLVLTFIGAAGLIIGGFLDWIVDTAGTDISYQVFYARSPSGGETFDSFYKSAGFFIILVGLVAIIGLAPRTGVLTRLAGALGLVGFILFAINVYRRTDANFTDFDVGMWFILAGSVVALIGGFFGSRVAVVATPPATTYAE